MTDPAPHARVVTDDSGESCVVQCACGRAFIAVGEDRRASAQAQHREHAVRRPPRLVAKMAHVPAKTLSELVGHLNPDLFAWEDPSRGRRTGKPSKPSRTPEEVAQVRRDALAKGAAGRAAAQARITAALAPRNAEIRAAGAAGESVASIAARYGMHVASVHRLIRGAA